MSNNANTELMETLFEDLLEQGFTETEIKENGLVDKLFFEEATMDELIELYMGDDYDDSMDGDHASALASCGWGTDEDYGDYGYDSY